MKNFLIVFVLITLIVFAIFKFKDTENGFSRKFAKQDTKLILSYEFLSPSLYFAGQTEDEMFLKDVKHSNQLYSINYSLTKSKKIGLEMYMNLDRGKDQINSGIQDSVLYLTYNNSGMLIKRNILSGKTTYFGNPNVMLDNSGMLTSRSLFGRSTLISGNLLSRQLVKINYLTASIEKKYNLEKQVDGYFCTDGALKFDVGHARIYYMYFYRGEFLCLDTNLNLIYRAKTIDTIKKAAIELSKPKKYGQMTYMTTSKPPKPVNRNLVVLNGLIYSLSAVKADNETLSSFNNNQAVDVYAMVNGKYLYSFYIPKYKGIKLREFYIKDDFIYAIFRQYLVKYSLKL